MIYGERDTQFWNGDDVCTTLTEEFADARMPDKGKLPCVIETHHAPECISLNDQGGSVMNVEELAYTQNTCGVMGVVHNQPVRRLLPVECERLMGFPDNWTKIPYRRKSEEECPDSPRYKACGNSMCVNVMRWIGKRIDTITKGETK